MTSRKIQRLASAITHRHGVVEHTHEQRPSRLPVVGICIALLAVFGLVLALYQDHQLQKDYEAGQRAITEQHRQDTRKVICDVLAVLAPDTATPAQRERLERARKVAECPPLPPAQPAPEPTSSGNTNALEPTVGGSAVTPGRPPATASADRGPRVGSPRPSAPAGRPADGPVAPSPAPGPAEPAQPAPEPTQPPEEPGLLDPITRPACDLLAICL